MSRRDGRGNGWPWIAVVGGFVVALAVMGNVTESLGAAAIPIWFFLVGGGAFVLRGPLGKAIAEQLRGGPERDQPMEVPNEVYAELDELRARLLEVEERQDFAERLLAQHPEAGQPHQGSSR